MRALRARMGQHRRRSAAANERRCSVTAALLLALGVLALVGAVLLTRPTVQDDDDAAGVHLDRVEQLHRCPFCSCAFTDADAPPAIVNLPEKARPHGANDAIEGS